MDARVGGLDDVRQLLRQRLASHEWWFLPWINTRAEVLSIALEKEYDSIGRSDAFEVVMLPAGCGVPVVSLCRKEWLPPADLLKILRRYGHKGDEELLRTKDVLIIFTNSKHSDKDGMAYRRLVTLNGWMFKK